MRRWCPILQVSDSDSYTITIMDSKDEKTRERQVEDANNLSLTSSDVDVKDEKKTESGLPGALDESLNDWDAEEERKVRYVVKISDGLGHILTLSPGEKQTSESSPCCVWCLPCRYWIARISRVPTLQASRRTSD